MRELGIQTFISRGEKGTLAYYIQAASFISKDMCIHETTEHEYKQAGPK
jgi:hypothetical protein